MAKCKEDGYEWEEPETLKGHMMEFFLPMKPPRTTHQMKAVRVVCGKPFFYEPRSLQEARSTFRGYLSIHRPSEPLEGPLRVSIKWLFPTKMKKDHGTYKITRPDLDNMAKLLFDVMTDLGFWGDDAQVGCAILEKFWTVETPGIWISIELAKASK